MIRHHSTLHFHLNLTAHFKTFSHLSLSLFFAGDGLQLNCRLVFVIVVAHEHQVKNVVDNPVSSAFSSSNIKPMCWFNSNHTIVLTELYRLCFNCSCMFNDDHLSYYKPSWKIMRFLDLCPCLYSF